MTAENDQTLLAEMARRMPRQLLIYGIGSVTIASTNMEMAVGALYAALLDTDLGEVVAHGQGIQTASDGCRAIINHLPESDLHKEITAVLAKAKDLYEQRNRVVHGFWVGDLNTAIGIHTVRFKRWGKRDVDPWTADDLMNLVLRLSDCVTELSDLTKRVKASRVRATETPVEDGA